MTIGGFETGYGFYNAVKMMENSAPEKTVGQKTASKTEDNSFSSVLKGMGERFPYSSKANDGGVIEYNGVVFVGDEKKNSLSLGDMSNKNRILRIQLSGGGMLNVNYDNIGDLKTAIGMFSGRDQGIILKAISNFHYEQGFVKDAEDEQAETIDDIGQESEKENTENVERL